MGALKLNFVVAVVIVVVLGMSADQFALAGTSCATSLLDNDNYTSCMKNLTDVFTSADLTNQDAIYEAMCSQQGRDAMSCFMGFYMDCPELAGGSGMDASMFDEIQVEGGMDVACEILVGPCKDFRRCMTMLETIDFSSVEMPTVTTGIEAGEILPYVLVMMCGPLKEYVLCFLDALEDCPNILRKIEEFTTSLKPDGEFIWPDFTEMRTYMTTYCAMEGDFNSKKTCVADVVKSSQLTTCLDGARVSNGTAAETTCSPYFAGRECAVRYIGNSCGDDAARFYATGLPFMYTEFKENCEPAPQVGGRVAILSNN